MLSILLVDSSFWRKFTDKIGFFGRGGQIRTADLTDPNRARYQTALRPERNNGRGGCAEETCMSREGI
jgi:hypothetical protein